MFKINCIIGNTPYLLTSDISLTYSDYLKFTDLCLAVCDLSFQFNYIRSFSFIIFFEVENNLILFVLVFFTKAYL